MITPELVAEHNLSTDEYTRIVKILGREPVQVHAVAQKGALFHVFRRARINHQNQV